eukprot:scaffold362575_cov22-Prasinocladus_malaysianus.AAC.1
MVHRSLRIIDIKRATGRVGRTKWPAIYTTVYADQPFTHGNCERPVQDTSIRLFCKILGLH